MLAAAIILAVLLVLGLGLLIFWMMRRSTTVIPMVTDEDAAHTDHVVAVDDQGRPVMESQEGADDQPRDTAAFEDVLHEEMREIDGDSGPGAGD